jgi:hypothetical protein
MSAPRNLVDEDESRECAVLTEILRLHPTNLTVAELIRLMGADPSDFHQADSWRRAIGELCQYGLLRRDGQVVVPTIAVIRFSELLEVP